MGGTSEGQLAAFGARFFCVALLLAPLGCGTTILKQRYYLAVPSGENTNYFRIDVKARTVQGVTEYRSGWFPADAVDSLYGVVDEKGSESLKTRQELQKAINQGLRETMAAYIAEAKKENADLAKLERLLQARKRITAAPSQATALPNTAIEMEYDPEASLVLRRANEKLVLMLSSNPDAVVSQIANFAEGQKTSVSVSRIADVIVARGINEVAELDANNKANANRDKIIRDELSRVLESLSGDATRDRRKNALREIDALRVLIGGLE